MKKALSLSIINRFYVSIIQNSAFAAENKTYHMLKVFLMRWKHFEEDYTLPRLFSYDSGWKSFLGWKTETWCR